MADIVEEHPRPMMTSCFGASLPAVSDHGSRVCPVGLSGSLDNRLRRWLQDPRKILRPYVREGMTVLDLGCGPGFFTIDMARMVGGSGRVIACDLQEGMLARLGDKIRGTELEERITLHKCAADKTGLSEAVDFILAFYVVHEIPGASREKFLKEMKSILKPDGRLLIVEPPFHVSRTAFEEMVQMAKGAGFTPIEAPKVLFSKTVLLSIPEAPAGRFETDEGRQGRLT